MRERLEVLVRQEEAARLRRLSVDRAGDPRGFVRADATWNAAHRQLAAGVVEAVRAMGLLREASKALRGTGYAINRFPLQEGVLRVELTGGPDSPLEFLQVTAAAEALRAVLDDFHSATGVEVRMPDELLR